MPCVEKQNSQKSARLIKKIEQLFNPLFLIFFEHIANKKMIRYHQRRLKSVRLEKKSNRVGDKIGGTGLRFCSDAVGELPMAREDVPDRSHKQMWLVNHPGQIMESAVHDRTRWLSSKVKAKNKAESIRFKKSA